MREFGPFIVSSQGEIQNLISNLFMGVRTYTQSVQRDPATGKVYDRVEFTVMGQPVRVWFDVTALPSAAAPAPAPMPAGMVRPAGDAAVSISVSDILLIAAFVGGIWWFASSQSPQHRGYRRV